MKNAISRIGRNDGLFPDVFDMFDDMLFVSLRPLLRSCDVFNPAHMHTDIKETDDSYVVEAELPGFDKEDIELSVDNGVLTIHAESKKDVEDKKDNYVRVERYKGSYSRSYNFEGIDEDAIKAKYDNGVLTVTVPKTEKKETKKGISVE